MDDTTPTPAAAPLGSRRNCLSCNTRKNVSEFFDDWECQQCRNEYKEKTRTKNASMTILTQQKALGQAVNSMVTSIGQGKYLPKEPHVVYEAVMEQFGGVTGVAVLMKHQFDRLIAQEKPSEKVVLDYFKSIFMLGIEAQKTAPPAPNFDNMSDSELGEYTAQLMRQKFEEMQEIERLKLEGPKPIESTPLFDALGITGEE